MLTRPGDLQMVPRAKQVIATVLLIQTILTAATSAAMALYTVHVAQDQDRIEALLTKSHGSAQSSIRLAVSALLAQWGGWSNCAAKLAMSVLWLYVGFIR